MNKDSKFGPPSRAELNLTMYLLYTLALTHCLFDPLIAGFLSIDTTYSSRNPRRNSDSSSEKTLCFGRASKTTLARELSGSSQRGISVSEVIAELGDGDAGSSTENRVGKLVEGEGRAWRRKKSLECGN